MATGYTYPIQSGEDTSLRGFALRVVGIGPDWKPEEPTEYRRGRLIEAAERFQQAASWSDEEADAAAEAAYQENSADFRDYETRSALEQERYRTLLAQVTAWEVPVLLADLRERMIEMLTEEIEKETRLDYPAPVRYSGEEYRLRKMESAAESIGWAAKDMREERERIAERNEYMAALFAALERA